MQQNMALAEDLVAKLASGKPSQHAIHAPTSSLEGELNPHLHLMISDREDDGIEREADTFFSRYNGTKPEAGGRRKASGGRNSLQLRDDVIAKRKLVADTINEHLANNGHEARVDHRTLKERGITRAPERRISAIRIGKMSDRQKAEFLEDRKKTQNLVDRPGKSRP